jgi:hypothetical protein
MSGMQFWMTCLAGEFMNESPKPVVHVVFGMSAAGSLREAIASLGLDDLVVGLPDDLGFGPINPPANQLRDTWMEEVLQSEGYGEYRGRIDHFWAQATDPAMAPIAWVCRRSASEYCGFLEFIRRVGDQPFQVIDITDVELPASSDTSGSPKWVAPTFGYIPSKVIIDAGLIDRRVTLSPRQRDQYRQKWARLTRENAPFRIVTEDGIISALITHFDAVITSCISGDWKRCARALHEAFGKLAADNFSNTGDMVLWSRMCALAEQGELEMEGDGVLLHENSVRLPVTQ